MNSMKKVGLVMALLAGINIGCGSTNFTKNHPDVKLEKTVQAELENRDYVGSHSGVELIKYDSDYTNVKYYSFVDKKVVNIKLNENQIVYDGIVIEGDKNFRKNTVKALDLLRENDFEDYRLVLTNIKVLTQKTNDESWSDCGRTTLIGCGGYNSPSPEYAGGIVHEATHLTLKNIVDEQEEICYGKQLEVYKKLGARECAIFALERFIKRKGWRMGYINRNGKEKADELLYGTTKTNSKNSSK